MSHWLVDSSVVAKWVLLEPDTPQANRVISETAGRSGRLFVLDMAIVEVANVIWKHFQRRLLMRVEAGQALVFLQRASVHIESSRRVSDAGFAIALTYEIAVYDALFVALARDLKVGGVTADVPLVRAVSRDFPEIVLLKNW